MTLIDAQGFSAEDHSQSLSDGSDFNHPDSLPNMNFGTYGETDQISYDGTLAEGVAHLVGSNALAVEPVADGPQPGLTNPYNTSVEMTPSDDGEILDKAQIDYGDRVYY